MTVAASAGTAGPASAYLEREFVSNEVIGRELLRADLVQRQRFPREIRPQQERHEELAKSQIPEIVGVAEGPGAVQELEARARSNQIAVRRTEARMAESSKASPSVPPTQSVAVQSTNRPMLDSGIDDRGIEDNGAPPISTANRSIEESGMDDTRNAGQPGLDDNGLAARLAASKSSLCHITQRVNAVVTGHATRLGCNERGKLGVSIDVEAGKREAADRGLVSTKLWTTKESTTTESTRAECSTAGSTTEGSRTTVSTSGSSTTSARSLGSLHSDPDRRRLFHRLTPRPAIHRSLITDLDRRQRNGRERDRRQRNRRKRRGE